VSRTPLAAASLCTQHSTLERTGCDGIGERDVTVDHDHRELDAIAPLEIVVAVDGDAPKAIAEARRLLLQQFQGARAEPASRPFVEHDLDRASPRR
jgi:hypothetical protein